MRGGLKAFIQDKVQQKAEEKAEETARKLGDRALSKMKGQNQGAEVSTVTITGSAAEVNAEAAAPADSTRSSAGAPVRPASVAQEGTAAAGAGAPPTTYTATLKKTPLGLGCSFDGESVVTEVRADSQAARAGLQRGDQLLAVNGESPEEGGVDALLQDLPVGCSFEVKLSRGAARPTQTPPPTAPPSPPDDEDGTAADGAAAARDPLAGIPYSHRTASERSLPPPPEDSVDVSRRASACSRRSTSSARSSTPYKEQYRWLDRSFRSARRSHGAAAAPAPASPSPPLSPPTQLQPALSAMPEEDEVSERIRPSASFGIRREAAIRRLSAAGLVVKPQRMQARLPPRVPAVPPFSARVPGPALAAPPRKLSCASALRRCGCASPWNASTRTLGTGSSSVRPRDSNLRRDAQTRVHHSYGPGAAISDS